MVTKSIVWDVAVTTLTCVSLFYVAGVIAGPLVDQYKSKKEKLTKARELRRQLFERLNIPDTPLSEHEEMIASEVVNPADIEEGFSSIGGQDEILAELKETVVFPLCHPELFGFDKGGEEGVNSLKSSSSSLLQAPKGVLLYGPPGVGKTLIAKALAKESKARFINLRISSLTDKYLGESEKLIHAVFSLAQKIQPVIIFIDEIDALLRQRQQRDHEVIAMMKAEFMTLWDGLSSQTSQIVVLGATNRPSDIDAAFLRRMPKRFKIGMPDAKQRTAILERIIAGEARIDPDVDLKVLGELSNGLSGSDLKELCRNVLMIPIQEAYRSFLVEEKNNNVSEDVSTSSKKITVRNVCQKDFMLKLEETFKSRILTSPFDELPI